MAGNSYIKPARKEIALDVSKVAINNIGILLDEWEVFVTVTGELPDVLIVNSHQMQWYKDTLIKRARRYGWEISKKFMKSPTFKGIEIRQK